MGWTTIPRWLRAALDAQITEAEAFLARAREALARYRKRLPDGP